MSNLSQTPRSRSRATEVRHETAPTTQEWLEAQAQAAEYRRLTAELNAYANPTPANKAAAQKVRETLAEKRRERTKEAE